MDKVSMARRKAPISRISSSLQVFTRTKRLGDLKKAFFIGQLLHSVPYWCPADLELLSHGSFWNLSPGSSCLVIINRSRM